PYERMMRDARINLIGEGANDVMRAFIAVVGMRDVGVMFKDALDALMHPLSQMGAAGRFLRGRLAMRLWSPDVPVQSRSLQLEAARLGKRIKEFGLAVEVV